MTQGTIKKGMSTMVGNSGEYFVMASLLKRGIIAALAPRNTPYFDILATDGKHSVNIRVKTKFLPSVVWQWQAKENGAIYKKINKNFDFVCLVDLKTTEDNPDYYIIPTIKLSSIIMKGFKKWVNKPGKNGGPHDPKNKHRCFGNSLRDKKLLAQAKDNWKILGLRIDYAKTK